MSVLEVKKWWGGKKIRIRRGEGGTSEDCVPAFESKEYEPATARRRTKHWQEDSLKEREAQGRTKGSVCRCKNTPS